MGVSIGLGVLIMVALFTLIFLLRRNAKLASTSDIERARKFTGLLRALAPSRRPSVRAANDKAPPAVAVRTSTTTVPSDRATVATTRTDAASTEQAPAQPQPATGRVSRGSSTRRESLHGLVHRLQQRILELTQGRRSEGGDEDAPPPAYEPRLVQS
jgi:hypothetical protein